MWEGRTSSQAALLILTTHVSMQLPDDKVIYRQSRALGAEDDLRSNDEEGRWVTKRAPRYSALGGEVALPHATYPTMGIATHSGQRRTCPAHAAHGGQSCTADQRSQAGGRLAWPWVSVSSLPLARAAALLCTAEKV